MGCLLKFRTEVHGVFSSPFAWYGRRVGTYPWVFVLASITMNALLGLGILRLTLKTGVEDVYVPMGNQAAKDRILLKTLFPDKSNTVFYQQHVPDDGKYGAVIMRSTDLQNVLRPEVFDEIETVYQRVLNISFTDPASTRQLDYRSVCARRYGNCIIDGDIVFSDAFKADLATGNISYPQFNISGYGPSDLSLFLGQVRAQNGLLQSAASLKLKFNLRQDSFNSSELSSLWEDAFIRAMSTLGQGRALLELAYVSSDSLDEELEKNTGGDIKWFSLTFTLMITYASIASSGGNWVSSRGYLACAGVLAAGLGIVSGMGLVSLCGVPFTGIVGVMPFLVLVKKLKAAKEKEKQTEKVECPVCLTERPDDYPQRYCSAQHAYKTYAGRDGTFPLKLQADFRPKRGKVAVNGFARFSLNPACQCDVLKQTGRVMVLAPSGAYTQETLTLDSRVTVVPVTSAIERESRKLSVSCAS